jgi:hypothetical protein
LHGAHLVAAVVRLGAGQIHAAALHLAPRRSGRGRGRRRPGPVIAPGRRALPLPATSPRRTGATSCRVLVEVDLLAELEPADVVAPTPAPASAVAGVHCRKLPCYPV